MSLTRQEKQTRLFTEALKMLIYRVNINISLDIHFFLNNNNKALFPPCSVRREWETRRKEETELFLFKKGDRKKKKIELRES